VRVKTSGADRAVTINAGQRLYVIPESGGGYSCLGFDVVVDRYNRLAAELIDPMTVSRIDRSAKVEHLEMPFKYRVFTTDGSILINEESHAVCDAVAYAYNHPEQWEPTEAFEIAEGWHARRRQKGLE
jgi:hypothetical protein